MKHITSIRKAVCTMANEQKKAGCSLSQAFRKAWKRVELSMTIRVAGHEFDRITPHVLRHTLATRAIEAGMQPQVLKAILGHSSLAMTMDLYSHVLPDTKAEEMEKIANVF